MCSGAGRAGRATPSALRVAYRNDVGKWGSLQVDFVVISRRDDGSLAASIVDPHGDHLADAKAKLRGLADYERPETAVCHLGDGLNSHVAITESLGVDLLDAKVRDAVRKFEGGKVTALYESDTAVDYQ